MHIMSSSSS